MIVRTFDGLQALTRPGPTWSGQSSGSVSLYGRRQAYAELYRTQPNIRICVDFLSRNIAQLGLHVFRRVNDTDRQRLADHDLVRWFKNPNPSTRRYRLFESLIGDLGIYFEAYWLKVRYIGRDNRDAIGLVRLPPDQMSIEGGLMPKEFIWTPEGRDEKPFPPSEIVYFNGYNPCHQFHGLSPCETLRRVLAEETAAGEQREQYWRNAARFEGVWERTKDSPKWTEPQWQTWREQWQDFAGGGAKAGQTAVGPIGSTYKQVSFSAKDSEFVAGGKLRREVCAAAYHIPQPMVGILDHATFSNIREQHKHTYQDSLAPWLEMITEEIEGQLLIESEDQEDVYTEFNIAAKLQGTFEERASAIQVSVGKPWRTVNEARALDNLPRDPDPASDRIAPQQGGPSDATAQPTPARLPAPGAPTDDGTDEAVVKIDRVLQAWHGRVTSRIEKVPADERAEAFDVARWRRELAEDLTPLVGDVSSDAIAARVTEERRRELLAEVEAAYA